jgi:hypothetical protein
MGVTIYYMNSYAPFAISSYAGFSNSPSLAGQFTRWGNNAFSNGRYLYPLQGVPVVKLKSSVSYSRYDEGLADVVHPRSVWWSGIDSFSRFANWPSSLRPDPRDPSKLWAGSKETPSSVRVASVYGSLSSYASFPSAENNTYTVGQFVVNSPTERRGLILCGTIDGDTIKPPWLFFSAARAKSEYTTLFEPTAKFAFDQTVLPTECIVLELDYRTDEASREVLARVLVLPCSLSDARASVYCDDALTTFGFAGTLNTSSNGWLHPVNLSADIDQNKCAGNDCGYIVRPAETNFILEAACSGIPNTELPVLRKDAGPIDWADTVPVSFVSVTSPVQDGKNEAFEYPSMYAPYAPVVSGLGRAGSPLSPREDYDNPSPVSYAKHESDGVPRLVNGPLRDYRLACEVNARRFNLWLPRGAKVPALAQSEQSSFVFAGKEISGTAVRFDPWASDFVANGNSYVEAPGRDYVDFTAIADTETTGFEYVSYSTAEPPPDNSRVYFYQPASGDRVSMRFVELKNSEVIPGTGSRRYDSDEYYPMSRVNQFRRVYTANTATDEQGYMAGVIFEKAFGTISFGSSQFAGPSFAFAQDQIPPVPAGDAVAGVPPERITVRNPLDWRISQPGLRPSLAGVWIECNAASDGGVPFSAGTFSGRRAGQQFSVTLHQRGSGLIKWREYVKPFPTVESGQSQVPIYYRYGDRSYQLDAIHTMNFQTTLVEVYVRWFVALQRPGDYSPTPYNTAGVALNEDAQGQIAFNAQSDVDNGQDIRPVLAARVYARAVGKVSVSSDWTFPELLGMSGNYKTRAAGYNATQGGESYPGIFNGDTWDIEDISFLTTGIQRKDGSYAVSQDVGVRDIGLFRFNRDETASLLAGNEVTATRWAEFAHDDPKASYPQVVNWHNNTFGTYKLTFRLNFASPTPSGPAAT